MPKQPNLGKVKLHRFKGRMWATFNEQGRIATGLATGHGGIALYEEGMEPADCDEINAEVEVIIRPISKGERIYEGSEE